MESRNPRIESATDSLAQNNKALELELVVELEKSSAAHVSLTHTAKTTTILVPQHKPNFLISIDDDFIMITLMIDIVNQIVRTHRQKFI